MALLVGELKSVLSLDTSAFDRGLSSSESKFKGSAKKLDATSKEVAKKASAGLASTSIASDRARLAQDKYTASVKKYGASSLQARTASLSMRSAQENLAKSNRKAADSSEEVAHGAGVAGVATVGVGLAVVAAGMKVADYAGRLELLKKKSATVFGDQLSQVQTWAAESAHAMGLTKGQATGLAAGLGDLLIPMGFTRKAAADMATSTVGLSGALAEWSGGTKTASDVTDILSAAFMGERDGLNALGISITQAEVDAALLAKGQQNLTGKQLQQAEATATQKLIMEKSTDAQKAYADGAGSMARQSAEARAKLKEMGETLATKAAPALLKVSTFVNEDVIPAISKAGGVAKKLGDTFMGLPAPVKAGVLTLAGFITAAAGTASMVSKAKTGIGNLKEAFQGLSSRGKYLTLSLGAIGVALAAAAAIYTIFAKRQADAKQKVEDLRSTLNEQTGAITGNTRAYVANRLAQSGLAEKAKGMGLSLAEVTDAALGNQAALDGVVSSLDAVVAAGTTQVTSGKSGTITSFNDSAQAAKKLKEELLGMNGSLTDAQKQQMLAAEGAKANTTATAGQATAAGQAATALTSKAAADKLAADAAAEHEKKINDEIAAMLKMPGLVLSLRDAQRGWQEAVDASSASLKENGKTLDITTPKGRSNQAALDAMANSANTVTKSMIDNGASNLSVVRTYEQNRAGLIKTAMQFGLNRKQAQAYAASVLAIPTRSNTTLKADITDLQTKLKTAKTKLNDKDLTKTRKAELKGEIKDLTAKIKTAQSKINNVKGKTVAVDVKFTSLGYTLSLGQNPLNKKMLATGGSVRGPGGPTGDQIPAMLSDNEHVWTAKEVAAAGGHSAMERMRKDALTGNLQGFATGGKVGGAALSTLYAGAVRAGTERAARAALANTGSYAGALGFARGQVGKPYVWGSAGPGGYDCSGFMGAITNFIRGRSPNSRVGSTGSFPWSGFGRGDGLFSIGSRKGNPGHMAGTLLGVNVESRGGQGVVVGSSARGAHNSLFGGNVYHLAKGGRPGDGPFDTLNPHGRNYVPELRQLLGYERGTSYVPRDGLAYLHEGERVVNADENSGKETMTVRLDQAAIRELATAMIHAARETPIVMDGQRLDEVVSRRAMSGGYG